MSLSAVNAMSYETTGTKTISKTAVKKLRETNINNMTSTSIVFHLVKKHKFGLLVTFTITYVSFSLFGTLIVGLSESLFN